MSTLSEGFDELARRGNAIAKVNELDAQLQAISDEVAAGRQTVGSALAEAFLLGLGFGVEQQRRTNLQAMYPADWPRCPSCGDPVLDGHVTCGRVECDEAGNR